MFREEISVDERYCASERVYVSSQADSRARHRAALHESPSSASRKSNGDWPRHADRSGHPRHACGRLRARSLEPVIGRRLGAVTVVTHQLLPPSFQDALQEPTDVYLQVLSCLSISRACVSAGLNMWQITTAAPQRQRCHHCSYDRRYPVRTRSAAMIAPLLHRACSSQSHEDKLSAWFVLYIPISETSGPIRRLAGSKPASFRAPESIAPKNKETVA